MSSPRPSAGRSCATSSDLFAPAGAGLLFPRGKSSKKPLDPWSRPLVLRRGCLVTLRYAGLPVPRQCPGPSVSEAPARLHRNCALWVLVVYPLAAGLLDCVPFWCGFGAVHHVFRRTPQHPRSCACPLQGSLFLTRRQKKHLPFRGTQSIKFPPNLRGIPRKGGLGEPQRLLGYGGAQPPGAI